MTGTRTLITTSPNVPGSAFVCGRDRELANAGTIPACLLVRKKKGPWQGSKAKKGQCLRSLTVSPFSLITTMHQSAPTLNEDPFLSCSRVCHVGCYWVTHCANTNQYTGKMHGIPRQRQTGQYYYKHRIVVEYEQNELFRLMYYAHYLSTQTRPHDKHKPWNRPRWARQRQRRPEKNKNARAIVTLPNGSGCSPRDWGGTGGQGRLGAAWQRLPSSPSDPCSRLLPHGVGLG